MPLPITTNASKCPRCNSKNVEIRKDPNDKARIICKKCSLSMITAQSNTSDAVMFFERSKTNRVKYIITCLKEYGNAYVGEFTLKVWGKNRKEAIMRLKTYLESQMTKKIKYRETDILTDEGVVFTF